MVLSVSCLFLFLFVFLVLLLLLFSLLTVTVLLLFFFFNDTATTEIYTLSLHDALPISRSTAVAGSPVGPKFGMYSPYRINRSEEHTSELQSRFDLVCRLLLEKKKK